MVRLSVIIPTYKRADILAECLRRLAQQTAVQDIEAIVVSDGHDDKTARLFVASAWPFPVRFFEVEKSQQGTARNEGVKHAQGGRTLFIGDDIFLDPDACRVHIVGGDRSSAVLGFTTWDPAVGITPTMEWLERSGWQFGYPEIAEYAHGIIPASLQHRFTYTSHISVPTDIVRHIPFRTDVHLYGWEDIEWGMRLKDAGVHLVYEPHAKALHHHRVTREDSLKRMETLGRSAVIITAKVPAFDRVPKGWKLWAYKLSAFLPTMTGRHRRAFLKGLSSGSCTTCRTD